MKSARARADDFRLKCPEFPERGEHRLIETFRAVHVDAMRAMNVVVEGTLCGFDTTVQEYREAVMSRIEACVDAIENGTTVPYAVKVGLPPAEHEADK